MIIFVVIIHKSQFNMNRLHIKNFKNLEDLFTLELYWDRVNLIAVIIM